MKKNGKFRVHPTPAFETCFEEAQSTRLFMVQETGPTKFVIENDEQQKFKVELGNTLKCSCGGGIEEHCIHTVYSFV